jgi:transposase
VVEYIATMSSQTHISKQQLIDWLGISSSTYYQWQNRLGAPYQHNGHYVREHWILPQERQAIIKYCRQRTGEGYRRLTYMMIDEDIVSVSPSTTYRVLKQAGLLSRWNTDDQKSTKRPFVQPTAPHEQWHIDIKYVNVMGTFLFFIGIIEGYSRYMVHMMKAVDTVRKREHWKLKRIGDETLTGTKYTWLYSRENLPQRHKARFRSPRGEHLKTARAWAINESFRDLWNYNRPGGALRHFKAWYFWAPHSRLSPVIEKAKIFGKYLNQIMSYFRHSITNAVSEGLNSKIETLRKQAYGFRNREHFKISVYFHCEGVTLSPVTHKKV